ncbi:MAG: hypothetical protein LBT30_04275 [Clostridiales bacterium]|jgi:hypothetical protein|nr:hypothetical protein [Clostridiales bacterium]
MKKFLKIFFLSILILVVSIVVFIGEPTLDVTGKTFTENDYSAVLSDSISGNPLVTDIAMLAAHDTLSQGIKRNSKINTKDSGGFLSNPKISFLTETGIFQGIAGGLIQRISVAQKSTVYDLLKRGVRYFDLRVAEYDGVWYGVHGLVGDSLDGAVKDCIRFMSENDGEIIVLEFRHIYAVGDTQYKDLFDYVAGIRYGNEGLYDYLRFDPDSIALGDLRYSDAVSGGSGVVLTAPDFYSYAMKKGGIYYGGDITEEALQSVPAEYLSEKPTEVYADIPRAVWHNEISDEAMLEGIRAEYNYLKENPDIYGGTFRINQAQKTPKMAVKSIPSVVAGWSLLNLANKFNPVLLNQADFLDWLSVMPVFHVDYADSMKDGFNDNVIALINEYNKKLI